MKLYENPFARYRANDSDDYEPSWDVPSHGQQASDALVAAVEEVRKNPELSGSRRIVVLTGPSGYGKSHLFGRIQQHFEDRIYLAYVPMTSDPATISVADHVRWKLVESLFDNRKDFAKLRLQMARLLEPSFSAFYEQLSEKTKRIANPAWKILKNDAAEVLSLLPDVHELSPYHHLSRSIQEALPRLSAAVIHAFTLSLSPASRDVQTWLRGEQDCLSPERRQELLLTDNPPDCTEVLRAVAALFQRSGKTVVLCLDQLELLFRHQAQPIESLVTNLMAWLQEIPNLVIALGCISDAWYQIFGEGRHQAFVRRTDVFQLHPLNSEQTVELVLKRLSSWDGQLPQHRQGWPFDLESVRKLAEDRPNPGLFIKINCSDPFEKWLSTDRTQQIGGGIFDSPPDFLKEWNARLEKTKKENKKVDDFQDAEILEAFRLTVEVAALGTIQPNVLNETAAAKRPSFSLSLKQNDQKKCVLLTFTKKDGGQPFGFWMTALEEGLAVHQAVGVVTIWPKKDLSVRSGVGLAKYKALRDAGKIRPFPIEGYLDVFRQVLTLRDAVLEAARGEFLFGGKALSKGDLFGKIREAKIFDGLKFYEFILNDWAGGTPTVRDQPTATITPTPQTAVAPFPDAKSPDPLQSQMNLLVQFLVKKKQRVIADGIESGPTFIRFRVRLEADADVSKIQKQAKNLETQLSLDREPIIDNHAGFVSIDVQRKDRETVLLAPLLEQRPAHLNGRPSFPAGKDVAGKITWLDLSEPSSCHLLVAGITGSGKSEFLKSILASLASSHPPSRLQFALIDPKQVTFNLSGSSPYLMHPVINDAEEAIGLLKRCCQEMRSRYELLKQHHKAKIDELPEEIRPARWVIVLDEYANLMDDRNLKKELESQLKSLSSMARAAGIHLILGTQRPEAAVVTTLLRSNLPCRIGFQVATGKDSAIIIDQKGAENLLGRGDFLMRLNAGLQRLQSPFVADEQFEKFLKVTPG